MISLITFILIILKLCGLVFIGWGWIVALAVVSLFE